MVKLKKYTISAKSVSFLETEVTATSEQQAYSMLEKLLENGEMPEVDGWIEDRKVDKK